MFCTQHISGAAIALAVLALVQAAPAAAQGRGAAPSPRAGAPIDLTGTWVSVVTEDWFWRMMTPVKGDAASVPLNAEGRKVTDAWDPARDEAAGEQCRSYGAPAVMRVPGRFRVSWENDTTLRIDTDSGMQTRRFHFGGTAPAKEAPSWQGTSSALWELGGPGGGRGNAIPPRERGGSLKVVTTNLRPGYLRKNGVPYSAAATVTEYYTVLPESFGSQFMVVTTIVEDPRYLNQPFITSTHFKKVPDGSGWAPTPCAAR
jgi:hypothetical protein